MRRIISLDFLRGLAIFCMIGVHVVLNTSWWAQAGNTGAILSMGYAMEIVFILVFLFSSFRAFFLIISMTVHSYGMNGALAKGQNPRTVLVKQVVFGIMLYLVGELGVGMIDNWGVLSQSMQAGSWIWGDLAHFLQFETLQSIALSIIIVSIIYYLLVTYGGVQKVKRNVTILAIIGIAFVVLETPIQMALNAAYGGYYYSAVPGVPFPAGTQLSNAQYIYSSAGQFLLKLLLAAIGGKEQPLFPFMGAACLGAIIGIYLSQPKVPKNLPNKGYLLGVLLIAGGVVILVIRILMKNFDNADIAFTPHETWLFLILIGMETLCYMFILKHVEFSPKADMKKFMKYTRWLRRWSMVALSLFVYEIYVEWPIRLIFQAITGPSMNFLGRGLITGLVPELLLMAAIWIVWDVLLRLWEKVKFVGSWEWIMAWIGAWLLSGFKRPEKGGAERLNIRRVLYEPEPVVFVTNDG